MLGLSNCLVGRRGVGLADHSVALLGDGVYCLLGWVSLLLRGDEDLGRDGVDWVGVVGGFYSLLDWLLLVLPQGVRELHFDSLFIKGLQVHYFILVGT